MNYTNFLLLGLALIFTLAMFPMPVSATTNVTVTSPNGGEVWGGSHNFTWDFNETLFSQDINYTGWLGTATGQKLVKITDTNASFLNSCSPATSSLFSTASFNYTNGLPARSGTPSQFEFNNEQYIGWLAGDNNIRLYKWSESSDSWSNVSPSTYNANISVYGYGGQAPALNCPTTTFGVIDNNLYIFNMPARLAGSGSANALIYDLNAFKISGSIVSASPTFSIPIVVSTNYAYYANDIADVCNYAENSKLAMFFTVSGTPMLFFSGIRREVSARNPFVLNYSWNGFNWVNNSKISTFAGVNPTGLQTYSFAPYSKNGLIYLARQMVSGSAGYSYNFSDGWVLNSDANAGLTTDSSATSIGRLNGTYFYDGTVEKDYKTSYLTNQNTHCSVSYNTANIQNGNYFFTVDMFSPTKGTDSSNASFSILNYSQAQLPITPIANISSVSYDSNVVSLSISNNSSDVIWSILNNTGSSVNVGYSLSNSDSSGSQYFVYTSTDGNSWVFDDTLTFGSTNSTPVQKIWNASTDTYDYSFSDTAVAGQTQYYKLVFQPVAKYWETIGGSGDWFNQNAPTLWQDSSGKNYDLFSDSNYTNIQSFSSVPFQNLVSNDFTVGYELQFTAYAINTANLSIGYRPKNTIGGSDSTATISVITTPTRFSIPIAPNVRDASLLIKSVGSIANTFYLTDFAIVPRSYYLNQLEVVNPDGTGLQSILRNGVSQQYVLEGQSVRIQTSAYDTSGDLDNLEIQTILGGVVVKDQFFTLTSSAGETTYFDQLIDGAIDLNGIGGELTTNTALRTLTYKAILTNTSNQIVSEQYKTVSILQYPYFPNDFRMTTEVLNAKVGTNPVIRYSVQQRVVENFLGIDVAIFDSSHSLASPNYYKRIYASELGCSSLTNCTKQLTFDDYSWEGTTIANYTVQVTALLSTEVKNYSDSYANNVVHVVATPAGYLLSQMKQYIERHQNATPHTPYKSTERVPLILGLIDDTGKNLGDTVAPYFTLTVDDVNFVTKYYPDAFAYDDTTGNNYWLFNQYLYDDSGNLLPDLNVVKFHGTLVDKRGSQTSSNQFALTQRCLNYPNDLAGGSAEYLASWWNGTIGTEIFSLQYHNNSAGWLAQLANFGGSILGTIGLNGCISYPPNLVTWGDGNESSITIDDSYIPSSDNRQALYCGQKYDNNVPVDKLGDEFECVLFIHQDQEAIDGVHIQIGNNNSDYSVTNENKQYLDFTVTSNDIIFTDIGALIRNWNTTGTPTNSPTVQDILTRWWHDTLTPQLSEADIGARYKWSQVIGGNTSFNLYTDLNNDVYNKAIAFKVSGLSVLNAKDFLTDAELNDVSLTNFLSYARENNLNANPKKLTITIYNNSSKPYKTIQTTSPIIINEGASIPQQVLFSDGNVGITTLPAQLPFKVISTMMSANQTKNSRLTANLLFNLIIKPQLQNQGNQGVLSGVSQWFGDTFFGHDSSGNPTGLFNAPVVFISNPLNIVLIIIIIAFALVFTLMARNVAPFFGKR